MIEGGKFQKDEIKVIKVDENGIMRMEILRGMIEENERRKGIKMVEVKEENNEKGVIKKVEEIEEIVKDEGGI